MRIWIDAEDLFHYAAHASRPSGIQRLAFELQRALVGLAPQDVRFLRHNTAGTGYAQVEFVEIEALFKNLSKPDDLEALPPQQKERHLGRIRLLIRKLINTLPTAAAEALRRCNSRRRAALCEAVAAIRELAVALRAIAYASIKQKNKSRHEPSSAKVQYNFEIQAVEGDWLLCLGSPWGLKDYADLVQTTCARYNLRFALLIYDIIPLRRPEWCDVNLTKAFRSWFHSVVPLADRIITISRTTARDAEAYAAETSMPIKGRIVPIPVGTGFGQPPAPLRTKRLPPAGSFVLFVSTIEARKNHILAFRIWRELLSILPREQLPTLVFAGRVGWLVTDLMQQLENANWLDGKVRLIESPSDGELAALYESCQFTLFPSFYEGWGLPVTESLAHGVPCLASNSTSLPEAGGALARYFDPDDLHDALRTVREVLENKTELAAWRAEIRKHFRPVNWRESAAATLRLLGHSYCCNRPA